MLDAKAQKISPDIGTGQATPHWLVVGDEKHGHDTAYRTESPDAAGKGARRGVSAGSKGGKLLANLVRTTASAQGPSPAGKGAARDFASIAHVWCADLIGLDAFRLGSSISRIDSHPAALSTRRLRLEICNENEVIETMRGALRARFHRSDVLTERPDFALVGIVRVPQMQNSPGRAITRRIGYALTALALVVLVVYLDRDGYSDSQEDGLSLLDCIYYATVSLSTTGYGDITPITAQARLVNILVITPLRIFFLIVLVGTTLSALTESSRQSFKIQRWRRRARNHTVVVGYGTKGRTAVDAMLGDGVAPSDIVVVDTDPVVLETAVGQGLVTVQGSATKSDVLRLAGVQHASSIIVATNRDDTAVLVTLTARELAPNAKIVAAIRESENTHLLRQSGADSVVISSETAGRLLGVATSTPSVVEMIEDLLTPESGLAIAERAVVREEIGGSPRHLSDLVLAVVRGGRLLRAGTAEVDAVEAGDKLLYIRRATD